MKPKRCLLVYKRSAYTVYFLDRKSSLYNKQKKFPASQIKQFLASHNAHYRSLNVVEAVLKKYNISYAKRCRGHQINYEPYDLVLTVGGDGTFLEAARGLRRQSILGINSDPQNSVGRFCSTTSLNFEKMLQKILNGKIVEQNLHRIKVDLEFDKRVIQINVLNDILICHANPAAMSRYYLSVHRIREEQRSSGIWVATAAGSSGAIHSAGGKILPINSQAIQYRPRELYKGNHFRYQLKGSALILKDPIEVVSLMRNGVVFIDGAHLNSPFPFGKTITMRHSEFPLKVLGLK